LTFDESLRKQQQRYDRTWQRGLEAGKEQRGNLQTNLEFLEEIGLLEPGVRILEIGCGIGSVVHPLEEKGFHAVGTDISTRAIEYGMAKYPGIDLRVQAAERLRQDEHDQ
jgi:2-polyprenyl-3-methyl-5-hydroxy-6-metoxy-1,4-benzoquinol methylase